MKERQSGCPGPQCWQSAPNPTFKQVGLPNSAKVSTHVSWGWWWSEMSQRQIDQTVIMMKLHVHHQSVPLCARVFVRKKGRFVGYLAGILSRVNQKGLITSRLKCSIYLLFTLHASHQTTNCPQNTKSVLTQTYIKQKTHKHQTQHFRRIIPFVIAPVKKAH